jgi:membrane-associated phospholipid phosphatase
MSAQQTDADAARQSGYGSGRIRLRLDPLRVLAGAALLAVLTVISRRPKLLRLEIRAFRAVNNLLDALHVPLNLIMQAGTFGAIVVTATSAFVIGRRRMARDLAVAGSVAYFTARLIKRTVRRQRPRHLLDNVLVRGGFATGLGFPSGHAAVASALSTAAAPHLPSWLRWVTRAVAWIVALSRIYVGVHLPNDVIAGTAMGWLVGGGLRLLRRLGPHRGTD